MCRSFTKENKKNILIRNKNLPGPGDYNLLSYTDFGYYHSHTDFKNNSTIDISKYKKQQTKGKRKRRGRKRVKEIAANKKYGRKEKSV